MALFGKSFFFYLVVAAVLLSVFTPEVEGRRNVLRNRKTVNRRYLRPMAIPAWAVILLVGIGQLIIGAIAYVIMKKSIIDPPMQGNYTLTATSDIA
ncbi:uncharacterized protein hoka [Euwallacea fornicatus]|uniref:uncharacterized protein hoka n=1 Tax=Euwallacea fornicatus TaxID=995702 RepID=UPI00338FF842